MDQYKDLINKELLKLKEAMDFVVFDYKKITSDEAINNRESEDYNKYINQYALDFQLLSQLREYSQNIADLCNKLMFKISKDALEKHLYEYDN